MTHMEYLSPIQPHHLSTIKTKNREFYSIQTTISFLSPWSINRVCALVYYFLAGSGFKRGSKCFQMVVCIKIRVKYMGWMKVAGYRYITLSLISSIKSVTLIHRSYFTCSNSATHAYLTTINLYKRGLLKSKHADRCPAIYILRGQV